MGSIAPLAVLLVSLSPAAAQIALPPADNPLFEAGSWPSGPLDIAVADVNSDGFPDWLAVGDSPAALTVALNSGHMRFGMQNLPLESHATELAAGDLDGDGHADVITLADFPWAVTTRLSDGLGGFSKVAAVQASTGPVTPRLGDLDGDGLPEAVVLVPGANQLLVFHGQGGGQLAAPVPYPAGTSTHGYALGDLDCDGDLDALESASPQLRRLDGNGTGGFGLPVELAATTPVVSKLELGDVDADGDLDAAALSTTGDQLALFLGDGRGGFASAGAQPAGLKPTDIALADVNLDGHADALIANGSGGNVAGFAGGAGTLTFAWSTSIGLATAMKPTALAVGDFNLDGKPDVACTLKNQFGVGHQTVVLRGLGTGALAGPSGYSISGSFGLDSRLVDISGDGINDLIVSEPKGFYPGLISWRQGTGSGGFLAEQVTATPGEPRGLVAGDLDADGDVDIAFNYAHAASTIDGFAAWMMNSGGVIGSAQSLPLGPGLPTDLAAGDLDADGDVDLVVSIVSTDQLAVLPGDGAGGFTGPSTWASGSVLDVLLHDIDQDGALDAIVGGAPGVAVMLGDGAGGFGAPTNFGGGSVSDPALADVDEDGDEDVVVLTLDGDLELFQADGTGGLLAPVVIDAGPHVWEMDAGDVDGDQHVDVLVLSDGLLTLERGDGEGGFVAAGSYDAADQGHSLTLGHANGDQRLDAVVTALEASQVFVHFNQFTSIPWVSLGGGLGGAGGVPVLTGNGPLTPGSPITLNLQAAAPNSPCVLFLGTHQGPLPFKGGTLVPAATIFVPLATNAAGKVSLSGPWPPGLPSGLKLLAQVWVHDPSAPHGAAGSGCEVGLVP